MTSKKAIGQTLSVVLSILLLWFSFRGVDWSAFMSSLKSCRWTYLVGSALVGATMPMCRSLRWRHTVLPFAPKISRRESIISNYVAYLVNMAIPLTHEATRCIITHRSQNGKEAPYDKLVGVAVTERACDIVCILIIFFVTAILSWDKYGLFVVTQAGGPRLRTLLLALIAIICAVAILDLMSHKSENKAMKAIRSFFSGMHEGLMTVFKLKRPLLYISETILLWVIYWLQLYLGTRAVPGLETLGAGDVLFLTLCSMLSTIIPVPGGFGAFHYVMATALAGLCGAAWTDGIAFATLVHESQTLALICLGAISIAFIPPSARKDITTKN